LQRQRTAPYGIAGIDNAKIDDHAAYLNGRIDGPRPSDPE
jgi:hypothetical protein